MTTAVSRDSVVTKGSETVKARQQVMWASGDFAVIGTTLQIVGELLCEAVDLGSCERVLDVAAGNGNATLAAARLTHSEHARISELAGPADHVINRSSASR